jgi:AbiU2
VGSPTIKQLVAWLSIEIAYGRAHGFIVHGLSTADRAVLDSAPLFFDLSLGAHADASLMCANRLFDRDRKAVSIPRLLQAVLENAGMFTAATAQEVRQLVADSEARVTKIQKTLEAVRTRRNETLAHTSPDTLSDSTTYKQRGRVTYRELGAVFEEAAIIVDGTSRAYSGHPAITVFTDAQDVKEALRLVAEGQRVTKQAR